MSELKESTESTSGKKHWQEIAKFYEENPGKAYCDIAEFELEERLIEFLDTGRSTYDLFRVPIIPCLFYREHKKDQDGNGTIRLKHHHRI